MKENMEGKFKPLGDRVLVRPEEGQEKTKSGLIIVESAQRGQKVFGEVLSVGSGIFSQNGERIPMTVGVGDRVMYTKDSGGEELILDGEKFLLFNEHQLLGILDE